LPSKRLPERPDAAVTPIQGLKKDITLAWDVCHTRPGLGFELGGFLADSARDSFLKRKQFLARSRHIFHSCVPRGGFRISGSARITSGEREFTCPKWT
ncbi:hypothetical protein BaRGS_00028845, partial [Batillaria attramentaria]